MAASRRSPHTSGKPPPERIGSWMAHADDRSVYLRIKAVEGDDWHAVVARH